MNSRSRKFVVWLVSLAGVVVVFLLYTLIGRTPKIEIQKAAEPAVDIADSNDKVGRVGSVGVGTIKKAKYVHLDKYKQVDREFGFERLLHELEDEWEIEKPYMNIYRHNLVCYITADKGTVLVEDAMGKPNPKDATLTSNVVVRIVPTGREAANESVIYLDDVIFISEKSQFSSAGPVKFVSKNALLLGTGFELVYNEEANRLELLRINDLDTLYVQTAANTSLFASGQASPPRRADKTVAGAASGTASQPQSQTELASLGGEADGQAEAEKYRCIFSENVIIQTPEQLVFADEVSISDILWSKAPTMPSDDAAAKGAADSDRPGFAVQARTPAEINSTAATAPAGEPQQLIDITITCDNGIAVVPMDSSYRLPKPGDTNHTDAKRFEDAKGRTKLVAHKIEHCLASEITTATGPSEATFFINDFTTSQSNRPALPVKIAAETKASFRPAENQVTFEGNCTCKATRRDPNGSEEYSLSAPKLTVDLAAQPASQPPSSFATPSTSLGTSLDHLTADGGIVTLATVKMTGEEISSFTKLKCRRFDYDANEQLLHAAGPSGVIAVDNSKIAEPATDVPRFSLQRPCYAVVRNFDSLKFFLNENRFVADAAEGRLLVDYFPIVKGKYGDQVSLSVAAMEAFLQQTAAGQTKLSSLSATGGISYEEKDIRFEGSQLFYDSETSIIVARCDEFRPTILNGALVDAVQYDLKTGKIKAKVTAPGAIRLK
jgi:hypothetical protein